jgi:hypothetical protein
MKLTIFLFLGLAGFFFSGCKKTDISKTTAQSGLPTDIPPSVYKFDLQTISYQNNQTSFLWRVVNSDPWSGQNQTGAKDLSEWSLVFKDGGHLPKIVAAYTGSSPKYLTPISSLDYSPVNGSCYTGNALQFTNGTQDGIPVYYKVVLEGKYNAGVSYAIIISKDKNCSKILIPGVFTSIY